MKKKVKEEAKSWGEIFSYKGFVFIHQLFSLERWDETNLYMFCIAHNILTLTSPLLIILC